MPARDQPYILQTIEQTRQRLFQVMGPLPAAERTTRLDIAVSDRFELDGLCYQRVWFTPEPRDRLWAWLIAPGRAAVGLPGVLCLHQTTRHGADEPAGLAGLPNLHYARELARRGFICLAPVAPSPNGMFNGYAFDWAGAGYQSNTMKAVWNHRRALDVLVEMGADPGRIGAIGHSLGGHNALFLAALDDRVGCVVTSCGFNSFHFYGPLAGWASDRYMPRIRDVYGLDPSALPFDFDDVLRCICPRPVYVNAPIGDANFPWPGVDYTVGRVRPFWGPDGPSRLIVEKPEAGHDFPLEQRRRAYDFLTQWLAR